MSKSFCRAGLLVLCVGAFVSCSKSEKPSGESTDSVLRSTEEPIQKKSEEQEITLSREAISFARIAAKPLASQLFPDVIAAPGRVVPTQSGIAHVGSNLTGRVVKLYVKEGTVVLRGSPMAELQSFELSEIKSEYLNSHAEVLRTEKRLERQTQLSKENVGTKRDFEESESEHSQAIARRDAASSKLLALGIDSAKLENGSGISLTIRSPISGIVSRRLLGLGAYVEPNTDLFEVLDLSVVWVDAEVPTTVAGLLHAGGSGRFTTPEGTTESGKVVFVSPTADVVSHMVTVRLEVGNPTSRLKPESFGTTFFEISGPSKSGFVVPLSALEKVGESYFVYKQLTDTTFSRISVVVADQNALEALISSQDLSVNERVVSSGVFYLKAARLKDELQDND
jgi:cobalt-zinc-cadmium efflux system membrane fusion protein